jgi:DNA polymerase I-like protein with 3'-5' exonuclease and polymerase domains
MLGQSGIDQWRGSVMEVDQKWFIAAHNPANILRKPSLEPIFRLDCTKLDMVRRGQWRPHHIKAHIDPTPAEAIAWCDKMIADRKPISFDIEVISGETACVGFANDPHEGYCINFRGREHSRWSMAEELRVRQSIQRVLRHGQSKLVAQNGGFDCGWLGYKDRIMVRPLYIDTLLAHHTLHPTWPHNLGFLTAQYTTHPFYKDEKDSWREGGDISTFWEYNVKDVCITLACAQALEAELKRQDLWDFYQGHVMRLQPHLIRATVLGNKVDLPMRERLNEEFGISVDRLAAEFTALARAATNDPELNPNPNSPKQLTDLFFNKLRLVGKGLKTNEANRDVMIANPRTPEPARKMLIVLNKYKEQHKLLSTYISAKVDDDGRMRSDYKQYGTQYVPGRLSSSSTLWGSGMNLQNQPEQLRGMFVADAGYCYVYFDGAQAEARIVAYEANIAKWKEQFERARLNPGSYDAHIALASEMFKVPYDSVPKFDYYDATNADSEHPVGSLSLRAIAKRCRHGLNYRMQAARLAATTGLLLSEAQVAFDLYHRTTPELAKWWDTIIREVRETRQLVTALGRRIEFLGSHIDEALFDSIIAFKPQSTLGDFVCGVQWKAQEDAQWPIDARIPFNNHDSLTAMCREKDVLRVASILKKYAEAPIYIKGEPLIIPADFKQSYADEQGIHRWSNMKKLKGL